MAKDSEKKNGCLVCMNVILLLIGLFVTGASIYLSFGKDIPPVIQQLSSYVGMAIIFGVILIVFAVIGFCASCGGCFLFIYSLIITVCSIFCLVVTIILAVTFFTIKGDNQDSEIVRAVDNITIQFVESPDSAVAWKALQDSLGCCGYMGYGLTGDACASEFTDCREMVMTTVIKYNQVALIVAAVITLVILILNCSSCYFLKNGGCC